jgi:hypothetical protein
MKSSLLDGDPNLSDGIVGLQVGTDGLPRVWGLTSRDTSASTLFQQTPQGTWTSSNAPLPPGGASVPAFTMTRDGAAVALDFASPGPPLTQLYALVGGTSYAIGSPTDYPITMSPTSIPMPSAPSTGARFAVAIPHKTAIGVAWLDEDDAVHETLVALPPMLVPTCPNPSSDVCPAPCHETGSGVAPGALAMAWTDDGVAWLAYVVASYDFVLTWSGGGGDCAPSVQSDHSTAVLHLLHVPLDGTPPAEVLTVPVAPPAGTVGAAVNMSAFGSDLAIGMAEGYGRLEGSVSSMRVLRIATSELASDQ